MRIIFIGTGEIGLPAFRWLVNSGHEIAGVFTQPDKPAGRSQEMLSPPIKMEALLHGIPVFQPRKIREPEPVAQIAAFAPDLIVVMAYGQILPRAILDAPRIACLNLHASLLPRHRGAAPIQAAILAGDLESGISVMYMDEGLDTGDVLLELRLPIHRHETGGSLHDRLAALAPTALEHAVRLLEIDSAPPRTPQDSMHATAVSKLTREHGLIPWSLPCGEIDRHIRAMNPWPGAYTWLPDAPAKKLKIMCAARNPRVSGTPGLVLRSGPRGLLVACGTGALLVRELQLEGKRRMGAGDFLRGRPVPPGTQMLDRP